jgi:hypothetical protein
VCANAEYWSVNPGDTVVCHDALHYFNDPLAVATRLAREGSTLLIGHLHTPRSRPGARGHTVEPAAFAESLPDAQLYDDTELTAAALGQRRPRPLAAVALANAEAFAAAIGTTHRSTASYVLPPGGTRLVRNPLLDNAGKICWPSDGYKEEFGAHLDYLKNTRDVTACEMSASRHVTEFARRRVLVDLPARW